MQETPIKIQMLGGFRISSGESHVEELTKRAPKFWKLLQYLIAFRHKSIPQEELISAIWPGGEEGDPGNAMRNMVFRIRSALAASGLPHAKEMILHSGGGYAWNNSLNCIIDFEEFEKLYDRSRSADITAQERLEILLRIIGLYKGDFLPNASGEMWVMPLTSYYRAIYAKCVHAALEALMDLKRYSQAEMICKKALLVDRYDEKLHEHHLRALVGQGKQQEAIYEYNKMELLFYDDMGVNLSEPLRALYLDIQQIRNSAVLPLDDLMLEWSESAGFPGAFYCEYGLFKTIYLIEARSVSRSGRAVYILSLEVRGETAKKDSDVMRQLYNAIQGNLRKGDLFTRASPNQYVLMLFSLNHENCKMLSKRILRALGKKYRSYPIKISIKPIAPVE